MLPNSFLLFAGAHNSFNMSFFLTPAEKKLVVPGSNKRVLRRPDLRNLIIPRLSGEPLKTNEVDFDDLIVHRTWRSYDPKRPSEVKYFMFELSQKNPGEKEHSQTFYKAMRLARLTRVPRYLRQATASSGPNMVFEQMRDVLAALREQGVLFTHLMAKSHTTPLIFAYGVQGVGETPEEAQALADDGYSILTAQLDGTYQQLKYAAISLEEGEALARNQAEWDHLAMGRGRPLPAGGTVGSASILDGNRTDIESTNNQLESFLRGMSDKEFMLSLITVPLSPAEITVAWRNITQELSKVRSEVQGQRSVNAGVALPLTMGHSVATTDGNTHSSGLGTSTSLSDGTSASIATSAGYSQSEGINSSVSHSQQQGTSASVSDSATTGYTQGQSLSLGDTVSQGQSLSLGDSVTQGQSLSLGDSASQGGTLTNSVGTSQGDSMSIGDSYSNSFSTGQGESLTLGESATASQGTNSSVSLGNTQSLTESQSLSQSTGVSQSQSLSEGQSVGQNWANSIGQSQTGTISNSAGWNQSQAEGLSQAINNTIANGNSISLGTGNTVSGGINGSIPLIGLGGTQGESFSEQFQTAINNTNTFGLSQTGSNTHTTGVSGTQSTGLSQGVSLGESFGGSLGQSASATNTAGTNQSVGTSQGLSATEALSLTQAQGVSNSLSHGTSLAQGLSQSSSQGVSQGQSLTQGINQGSNQATALAQSLGTAQSLTQGQSLGTGQSLTQGQSMGTSQSLTQGQSTAQSVSQGRTVGMGESQSFGQSLSQGQSSSASASQSLTQSDGTSKGLASNQSLSDNYAIAMSRSNGNSGSLAVAPSFGVSISRATFDEGKRFIGDILEAQMRRYNEGIKSGAFLYQMFLVCPDRETLLGASGLLKSAFWGAGASNDQLPHPFHTITEFDEDERERLLLHARAFTSYRKREPAIEMIEPFLYSSYLTPTEAAAFVHPPVTEGPGLLAVHDSMPVLRMPFDRGAREIHLGHIINGERAEISNWGFGIDLDELTHTLIAGLTGSGKTTTLMRFLSEAVKIEKEIIVPSKTGGFPEVKKAKASILGLDWMRTMRDLGSMPELIESGRFHFYSFLKPELGAFRWNILEVPAEGMTSTEWLNAQADNFTASFNLGEFGRSLIAEFLQELYSANRLEEFILRPAKIDDNGVVLRPALTLPKLDINTIPADKIMIGPDGKPNASALTYPPLSRCISMAHLATLVVTKIEELADPNAARLTGTAMRDRLQSLWRRMQYFAPGGQYNDLLGCDPDLNTRVTLGVTDLINPDEGRVTILETEGLDMESRRLVLGSVMLALYRYGLHHGKGTFDHDGKGPGAFVVMEESHELFGVAGRDEDSFSASTRTALYESMFRRVRQLGMRLVAVAQEPSKLPDSVVANIDNVFIHKVQTKEDRDKVFSMLNWSNQIGQQLREWRYLGEMPTGYCIGRLKARTDFLEAAPVQFKVDPPDLAEVSDHELMELAKKNK